MDAKAWVYPRPRGGASSRKLNDFSIHGLSPPTRGSLVTIRHDRHKGRSIPAHAGEPMRMTCTHILRRVYPRPRGGASSSGAIFLIAVGLSPPTRGSRALQKSCFPLEGSIPAHAGEPNLPVSWVSRPGVYPRPRGGASMELPTRLGRPGLSPPTRGSLVYGSRLYVVNRSIPAHAGEPVSIIPIP